jgi:hypothetical protein
MEEKGMPRKNPTEPTVELNIDGDSYRLLFSFEAIAEAEDLTGLPLISGLRKKDVDTPRIAFVRALLYACLRPHHSEVTYEEAAALVNQWNWSDIWGKVLDAWVAGMKKPDPKDAPDPLPDQG